jgi:SAM-dependent methyltransferase
MMDREIAPVWHDRFSRLIFRELPVRPKSIVLDVHCGPGHTSAELLQRLDNSSRIVALEDDPSLITLAKARVRPEWKKRIYFKQGNIDDVTDMGDSTYDLTIANLVLGEKVHDWRAALRELVRVTKAGGQVLATLPLHGTWTEVDDLFNEVLTDANMREAVATLQKLRRMRPKPSAVVQAVESLGFTDSDFIFEHERFEMLFRSGREFLFSPVVEQGPLRLWKAILGKAEKPQALFWQFKEAIDTYYSGRVLAVSAHAGLIRLRVPEEGAHSFSASYWTRYPELAKLWGQDDPVEEDLDLDLDLDMDIDFDLEADDPESEAETESESESAKEPTGPGTAASVSEADTQDEATTEFTPDTVPPDEGDTDFPDLDAMFNDDAIKELEAVEESDLDQIDENAILESFGDDEDEEDEEDDDLAAEFGEMLMPEPEADAPKKAPPASKSRPQPVAQPAKKPIAVPKPSGVPSPRPGSKSASNPAAKAMAKMKRAQAAAQGKNVPAPPIPKSKNVPAPPIAKGKSAKAKKSSGRDSRSPTKIPPPPPTGPHKKPKL